MPFVIVRDENACSASKPWAVKTQGGAGDGNVHGCFVSKEAARQQQKALYANVPDAKSAGNEQEARMDEHKESTTAQAEPPEVRDTPSEPWTTEQRDTARDTFHALQHAATESHPHQYVMMKDFYTGEDGQAMAVYHLDGDVVQAPYSVGDDNKVALGDAVPVRRISTYVERADSALKADCSTCGGSGKIRGDLACPDCAGTGTVGHGEAKSADLTVKVNVDEKLLTRAVANHTIALRRAKMPRRGERETRTLPLEELEIREEPELRAIDPVDPTNADGKPLLRFTGYASLFDRRYSVGPYEETISPGAFKRALGMNNLDTVLRVEHGDLPLARTTGLVKLTDGTERSTLLLSEDAQGLHVDALLDPEDPDVQRLVPKFRRGDLREMSFAFRCENDVWSDDYALRTIKTANIHRGDVAIVTYGASPMTTSVLRSESAALAVREFGFGQFLDAMAEWRDFTLLSVEDRAGRTISAANQSFLEEMLSLFATADEAVDEGQARLSDFLGVPNPDTDDEEEEDDSQRAAAAVTETATGETVPPPPVVVPALPSRRYAEFEAELRMLGRGR